MAIVGFQLRSFVRRCHLCNPPVLPCPGRAKLGEDHPQTLSCLNNMAGLLQDQGRLADAEPLFREALEKSPEAQLQRFQWDFGQWIWSHTLLDLDRVIRFLMVSHVRNWYSNTLRIFFADIDRRRSHCCQGSPRLLANSVSPTSGKKNKRRRNTKCSV